MKIQNHPVCFEKFCYFNKVNSPYKFKYVFRNLGDPFCVIKSISCAFVDLERECYKHLRVY